MTDVTQVTSRQQTDNIKLNNRLCIKNTENINMTLNKWINKVKI